MTWRGCLASLLLAVAATAQAADAPRHAGPITAVQILDGGVLALSQGGLFLHPETEDGVLKPGRCRWSDAEHRGLDFTVLPSQQLVVVGGRPGESGKVWWLDENGQVRAELQIAEDLLHAVVAAPTVRHPDLEPTPDAVVVGAADGRVLWIEGPAGRRTVLATHAGPCRDLASDGLGGQVISGGRDGVVFRIPWSLDAEGLPYLPDHGGPITDHSAPVDAVAITPTGGAIASGARDGRVRVHSKSGALLTTLPRLDSAVLSLAPVITQRPGSAAGPQRSWAVGLADGRLLLLDERAGREPRLISRHDGAVHALGVIADVADSPFGIAGGVWCPRPDASD